MYSSDEYEYEHAGTSASGSSAFGIGALDRIVKNQIKKKLDKNYDSEGNSIKETESIMEEYNKTLNKRDKTESEMQNDVIQSYKKTTPVIRVNSEEALSTVSEIRKKLGKQPSSVESSPVRVKRESCHLDDEISHLNRKKLRRPIRDIKGILKTNNNNVLSTENVSKLTKSKGKFERSRSFNTASTLTTNESTSSNSRNVSTNEFSLLDKSIGLNSINISTNESSLLDRKIDLRSINFTADEFSSIDKNTGTKIEMTNKVKPIALRCNNFGQFVDLDNYSDGEITDNDT